MFPGADSMGFAWGGVGRLPGALLSSLFSCLAKGNRIFFPSRTSVMARQWHTLMQGCGGSVSYQVTIATTIGTTIATSSKPHGSTKTIIETYHWRKDPLDSTPTWAAVFFWKRGAAFSMETAEGRHQTSTHVHIHTKWCPMGFCM